MTATLTATDQPGLAGVNRGASFVAATLTLAVRTVKKFVRTPQLIVAGTLQGVLFLVIFRYVFGGAIGPTGTLSYVDFLVPGFVMTTAMFAGMGSATGIAEDLQDGLVDRLRSLPVPALSIICGRVLADTALVAWSLAATTAAGFAVGFRVDGAILSALGGFGLCVVWGFAFCWLFLALGSFAGNAQAAQSLSFLVFPFTFISSAYVPVSTLPGWLRAFANHQPITAMADTTRILVQGQRASAILGHGVGHYLPASLLWAGGVVVVCAPVALWRLRHN
jgi:ABC-2 type transport system permease protein